MGPNKELDNNNTRYNNTQTATIRIRKDNTKSSKRIEMSRMQRITKAKPTAVAEGAAA